MPAEWTVQQHALFPPDFRQQATAVVLASQAPPATTTDGTSLDDVMNLVIGAMYELKGFCDV